MSINDRMRDAVSTIRFKATNQNVPVNEAVLACATAIETLAAHVLNGRWMHDELQLPNLVDSAASREAFALRRKLDAAMQAGEKMQAQRDEANEHLEKAKRDVVNLIQTNEAAVAEIEELRAKVQAYMDMNSALRRQATELRTMVANSDAREKAARAEQSATKRRENDHKAAIESLEKQNDRLRANLRQVTLNNTPLTAAERLELERLRAMHERGITRKPSVTQPHSNAKPQEFTPVNQIGTGSIATGVRKEDC